MPRVPEQLRTLIRVMCLVAVAMSLTAACGSPSGPRTRCSSPGQVYTSKALVSHEGNGEKDFEWITFALVCTGGRTVKIVDREGHDYESLEEFQEENDFLSGADTLVVPRDFPAVEREGDIELTEVPGHVDKYRKLLPVAGVVVAALAVLTVGVVFWRRRRRPVPDVDWALPDTDREDDRAFGDPASGERASEGREPEQRASEGRGPEERAPGDGSSV